MSIHENTVTKNLDIFQNNVNHLHCDCVVYKLESLVLTLALLHSAHQTWEEKCWYITTFPPNTFWPDVIKVIKFRISIKFVLSYIFTKTKNVFSQITVRYSMNGMMVKN